MNRATFPMIRTPSTCPGPARELPCPRPWARRSLPARRSRRPGVRTGGTAVRWLRPRGSGRTLPSPTPTGSRLRRFPGSCAPRRSERWQLAWRPREIRNLASSILGVGSALPPVACEKSDSARSTCGALWARRASVGPARPVRRRAGRRRATPGRQASAKRIARAAVRPIKTSRRLKPVPSRPPPPPPQAPEPASARRRPGPESQRRAQTPSENRSASPIPIESGVKQPTC